MKAIVASHETPCQWQRPPSSRAGPGRCSAAAAALTQPAARPGCRGHWQPECHWQGLSSRSLSSSGHWHWQPAGGACGLAHRGLRAAQSQSSRAAGLAEIRARRAGPTVEGRFQSLRFEFLQSCCTILSQLQCTIKVVKAKSNLSSKCSRN